MQAFQHILQIIRWRDKPVLAGIAIALFQSCPILLGNLSEIGGSTLPSIDMKFSGDPALLAAAIALIRAGTSAAGMVASQVMGGGVGVGVGVVFTAVNPGSGSLVGSQPTKRVLETLSGEYTSPEFRSNVMKFARLRYQPK